jgi:hypothetical protein
MRRLLCTLGDDELARRGDEWRTLLAAASERAPTPEGVRLVFPPDEGNAQHLDALIAKESTCCAWMVFRVERTPAAITVTVSGPEGARAGVVAAFANVPA